MSMAQLSSPDTKTVSSLDVKKKDNPLACDKEEDISIHYTVVGEAQGSVDMMYLVSEHHLALSPVLFQRHRHVENGFKMTFTSDY